MSLQDIQSRKKEPLHILITGSSRGIGLAAAQKLLQEGHTVYHACRNPHRAVEAAGGGVALEALDLADLDSVKNFAHKIPRLDVICLNAGFAPSTRATQPPLLTKQGFEGGIGVNHLGHFLLAQLLVSKLEQGGRLVITASSVHDPELKAGQSGGQTATLGDMSGLGNNLKENPDGPTMIDAAVDYQGGKVYKDSKLCNILMGRQAAEVFPSTITTVSFNPGFVPSTGLFDSLRQESWWKATVLTMFASVMGFSVPVEVAGDRLVFLATTPTSIPNGSYYCAPSKCHGATPDTGFDVTDPSKEACNEEVAAKLWNKSMEIIQPWL